MPAPEPELPAAPPGGAAGAGRVPPIVGLRREREVLTVALEAGRHVVIEGPPGTGKSTLLRDIARQAGRTVVFAEGNAELTPARLIGQYDPAQVLNEGYVPASFTDGPLLRAMRSGALLYLEEFNRVPEETLNVLITVLTEGEIAVPRLGAVRAGDGFRLVAAMNPFDAIGTARVSHAIADRICRVVLGYQTAAAEREITAVVTGHNGQVVDFAVTLTRATREHQDVRMGASVRGAIDLVLLLTGLARLRGESGMARASARDAAHAALSGRIRIADGCDRTPESVLDELLGLLWPPDSPLPLPAGDGSPGAPRGGDAPDGRGKAEGRRRATAPALPRESASTMRRERSQGAARRTVGRTELAARHPSFSAVSHEVGQLDRDAFAQLLAADPDAAVALLADLARATDRDLRAAARRLAARVFFRPRRGGSRPGTDPRPLVGALAPGRPRAGDPVLARSPPRAVPAHRRQRLDVGRGGRDGGRGRGQRGLCRRRPAGPRDHHVQRRRHGAAGAGHPPRARGACRRPGGAARAWGDRPGGGAPRGGRRAGRRPLRRAGGGAALRLPADHRRRPSAGAGRNHPAARA